MDAYVYAENYQKLVTEYNQLYDHYKGVKQINKRVKLELKNCNERERTFLKLLKKTEEYGPQASQLEVEYDRLVKEDVRLNGGFTLDSLVVDSNERRAMKQPMMEHHGAKDKVVKIPKLDLTSIYIQREAPVSGDKKKDKKGQEEEFTPSESSIATSEQEESVCVADQIVDDLEQARQKDQFNKEKMQFKHKIMQANKIK